MPHRLEGNERYAGQMALLQRFGLGWPEPFVVSIVGAGSRRSIVGQRRSVERYTARYDYGDTPVSDLKFALRNEPLDLGLLRQALVRMGPADLERWVAQEPTGAFSRRAWFLYERLTGKRLDLPDALRGNYVAALDRSLHVGVASGPFVSSRSERHRVEDNLLGDPALLCPTVRQTPRLTELMSVPVAREARQVVENCDPQLLTRAVQYLFTKETRSSFEIEGERVEESRAERFVRALQAAADLDPASEADLVALQRLIVRDPRYHARGWRTDQNFIGSVGPGYVHKVHCVFPRPADVPALMAGLGAMAHRLSGAIDPIVAAALVSFAFVFVHPFDDGNGRIHRYLIHKMLAAGEVTPPGVLFPVSATMLRDMRAYDAALESVSGRLMPHVDWRWTDGDGGGIEVRGDTLDLYRFFDATAVVEYLYERVIETVRKDLPEELEFVRVYDRAYRGLTELLDGLPAAKVTLLAKLCLQNGGRLAGGKRHLFPTLSEAEVAQAQDVVREAMTPA